MRENERKSTIRKPVEKALVTPPRKALPRISEHHEDPPPERPEILQSCQTELEKPVRERRRGMRSDPAWGQKTLFLKRVTIHRAEEISRLMGVEFSALVDYALGLQVLGEIQTPELKKRMDGRNRNEI